MTDKEAVIISISPKWCDEIFTFKEKNLEIRKTFPKALELPFTAYVYCTADRGKVVEVIHKGDGFYNGYVHDSDTPLFIKIPDAPAHMLGKTQKVIGKITIDRIVKVSRKNGKALIDGQEHTKEDGLYTCLTVREFEKYLGDKDFLYGWHIAEVEQFREPRELSEFGLKRPPQSWQYLAASSLKGARQ